MTPRYWSNSESKISARGGAVGIAAGRRHLGDDRLQDVGDALPRLRADAQDVVGRAAEQVDDLAGHALGLGAGQVDLVQAGDDLEAGVDREVGVGQRLGLDALGGVDDEDRALAGRERPADLVGEVDVARGVDEVELVVPAVPGGVEDADGLGLDRDPALALELHRVQELRAHVPPFDGLRHLEDAVRQGRLAVVDVGDDAEVADARLVHEGRDPTARLRRAPPSA